MDRQTEAIEKLFYDKILLYQELIQVLGEERDYLIKADIDALWKVSGKKQELVAAVWDIREEIIGILSAMSVAHGMTVSSFSPAQVMSCVSSARQSLLQKPYLALVRLKAQTRQLSAENKVFIEESLDFLDELMGVITGAENDDGVYGVGGKVKARGNSNRFFCREV